jgi:hypothetical protein
MTQASIGTIAEGDARSGFAWFLRALSEALQPRDRDGSLAAPLPCPTNPISGRARPILDQRAKAKHSTACSGFTLVTPSELTANLFTGGADVRRGDYHLMLRKR